MGVGGRGLGCVNGGRGWGEERNLTLANAANKQTASVTMMCRCLYIVSDSVHIERKGREDGIDWDAAESMIV